MEVVRSKQVPKCEFEVGQRVTISPNCLYADDWRGEWVVVAVAWDARKGARGRWDIAIQSEEEISHNSGWTDGFRPDDLLPVFTSDTQGGG